MIQRHFDPTLALSSNGGTILECVLDKFALLSYLNIQMGHFISIVKTFSLYFSINHKRKSHSYRKFRRFNKNVQKVVEKYLEKKNILNRW